MTTNRPSFFKSKLFINPKLQFKILAYTAIVIFLTISIVSVTQQYSANLQSESNYFGISLGYWVTFGFALFNFTLIFLFNLIFTHQIVGPLYRIKKHMRETADGVPPKPIQFRKSDQFNDIAVEYNRMLEKLTSDRK